MKLLVCDPTSEKAVSAIKLAGIEVDVRDDITPERLATDVGGYDAVIIRSRTRLQAPLLEKATRLKLIIRAGVGLDNVDVAYAQSRGIAVRNTAVAPSNSVAELTIGYLFALARQIPQMTASMKAGCWEKKTFSKGIELEGRTLGLVGCGRIGSRVARKGLALGMQVIYYCVDSADVPGAESMSLERVLTEADYISLHVPYDTTTQYLIGSAEIAKMKSGVRIINTGRGGTLDEDALYEAIADGKVAGVALDVFEDEKQERGARLMSLPQVIGSPHVGSGTVEAKARIGEQVAQIAIEFAEKLQVEAHGDDQALLRDSVQPCTVSRSVPCDQPTV
jgi:D-3-phosphoglycerate dehydrogenase